MNNTTPCQPIGVLDGQIVSTKRCPKCGADKPLDDFCVDRSTPTGRKSRCRPCVAEDKKIWAANNPEKKREWHLRWARENPEKRKAGEARFREAHREMLREQAAQYRLDNPQEAVEYRRRNADILRLKAKEWAARNPDKVKASQRARALRFTTLDRERAAAATREWCRANPGKVAMQRYAARTDRDVSLAEYQESELSAIGDMYEEAMRLTEETGVKMAVDHLLPLNGRTVSGLHVLSNLRVVTHQVNSRKHNFLPGVLADQLWDPNGDDVYYDGDLPRRKGWKSRV